MTAVCFETVYAVFFYLGVLCSYPLLYYLAQYIAERRNLVLACFRQELPGNANVPP